MSRHIDIQASEVLF